MDKYEYKVRADEIKELISEGNYAQAAEIADSIDWRRVKSVMMLCTISDLYKINKRYEDAKSLLLLAYERRPGSKTICYSLCELCLKMQEYGEATKYYTEYVQAAPTDPGRYILQYKLYEAQGVSLEERIAVLEELKNRDYREKWAYELAFLYHRTGQSTRCVEECDELILWFGEGKYVTRAMELKMLYEPLNASQQEKYDHRFDTPAETVPETAGEETGEAAAQQGEEPADGTETDVQGDGAEPTQEPELDIEVKPMEFDQCNTINLQEALAEGLREVLDREQEKQEEKAQDRPEASAQGEAQQPKMPAQGSEEEEPGMPVQEAPAEFPEAAYPEEEAADGGATKVYDASKVLEALEEVPTQGTTVLPFIGEEGEAVSGPMAEIVYTEDGPRVEAVREYAQEAGEDVSEEPAEEAAEEAGETGEGMKEILPAEEDKKTPGFIAGADPTVAAAMIMNQMRQEVLSKAEHQVITAQPPKEMAGVLSQEADGQLSLVVPDARKTLDEQITGQISISDVLLEWEKIKKESEEKRKEEVRQHVLEHTGSMFTEFEAAIRDGLLEQIERGKAVGVEPAVSPEPEEEEGTVEYEALPGEGEPSEEPETAEEPEAPVAAPACEEPETAEAPEAPAEAPACEEPEAAEEPEAPAEAPASEEPEAAEEPEAPAEAPASEEPETTEEPEAPVAAPACEEPETAEEPEAPAEAPACEEPETTEEPEAPAEGAEDDYGEVEEIAEIADPAEEPEEPEMPEEPEEPEAPEAPEEPETPEVSEEPPVKDTFDIKDEFEEPQEPGKAPEAEEASEGGQDDRTVEHEKRRVRALTPEEKELFGTYIQSRSDAEKMVKALDSISLAAYTGNIIITGEEGMDTLTLAKNMIRQVQMTDSNFAGKIAKISGRGMNTKDAASTLERLKYGALIIQKASDLNDSTVRALYKALQQDYFGIIVVIEDTRHAINKLLKKHPMLREVFTARMDVEALSNDTLAELAKEYALEREYSIDELGLMALHARIAELQTSDHNATIAEVREIIDEAIESADRKTIGHFFDILLGKRYDDEDMIILTEKDFA